ncbi:phage phi-C31 gp36 major capsid family protein [Lactiplantibacillus xiangfangensis]|uniref:Phage phi-C31 gp36 major capsid family protein n=1 Tax=Lactiplantibacillus xiangfangensis TaxID=942150 RepID=A0A0R2MQ01_9LACO|nr:phage major capsid protein [Lactiplantibacillus xiangfangensis]KRO14235.1 phage phi-C31 gp36 major capsid family protein [Lactiplantibacillus xiangfangensis]
MKPNELQVLFNKVSAHCADLNAQLNVKLADDHSTPEDYQKIKDELTAEKVRRDTIDKQLQSLSEATGNDNDNQKNSGNGMQLGSNSKDSQLNTQKQELLDYMKRKPAKNQVSSTEMSPVVPETIIYNPSSEVNSVVDLANLLTKTPVTTKKGTYPVKKRADDYLPSQDELKANNELAAPNFDDVDWSVETHRGALTISQEAIDDAEPSVLDIVGQDISEKAVNTHNHVIAPILKQFTAKSVTLDTSHSVDDVKHILNVDLDPAYVPVIIASQSFYNSLDTLKDKNGQYIFHQDITTPSKGTLLGVPVYRVGDKLFGDSGDKNAFIGDINRAVFFADRKEVNLSWEYDQVYGQYLAAVLRFGVSVADSNAGFFVSVTDGTSTGATTSTTTDASTK